MQARTARMARELKLLEVSPPPGISAWVVEDDLTHLHAQMCGPKDSPYEKGVFELDIIIPSRYPFEPPRVKFETPIYHPNIDTSGRICLDTLKCPPQGSWSPSINLCTVLTTLQQLLAHPNPDDGLMPDISDQYRNSKSVFDTDAAAWTAKHASSSSLFESSSSSKRKLDTEGVIAEVEAPKEKQQKVDKKPDIVSEDDDGVLTL